MISPTTPSNESPTLKSATFIGVFHSHFQETRRAKCLLFGGFCSEELLHAIEVVRTTDRDWDLQKRFSYFRRSNGFGIDVTDFQLKIWFKGFDPTFHSLPWLYAQILTVNSWFKSSKVVSLVRIFKCRPDFHLVHQILVSHLKFTIPVSIFEAMDSIRNQ